MTKFHIPPKRHERQRKSHSTDRIWDTTRDLCQALADGWNMDKIATYDVAIRFAALFDTPEELAALAEALGQEADNVRIQANRT